MLGNCKLKQWASTAYLLKWPKSKALATSNTEDNMVQQSSPSLLVFIAGGDAKWYSHFGRPLTVSCNTKLTFAIWCGNLTLWYLPKCPYQKLCMNISNYLETFGNYKMLFWRWVDNKLWRMKYCTALRERWDIKPWQNMQETWSTLLSKRSQSIRAIYCMSLKKAKWWRQWKYK